KLALDTRNARVVACLFSLTSEIGHEWRSRNRSCGFDFICNRITNLRFGRQPNPRPARIRRMCRLPFFTARSKHDGSKSSGPVEPQGGNLTEFQSLFARYEVREH